MKLINSFRYAIAGFITCIRTQLNFRIHLLAVPIVIAAGIVKNISGMEWVALTICICAVIAMEMLNTAIEKLCDKLHPGNDPVIKMVKDISAGAVLVVVLGSVITGLIIFIPLFSK